MDILEYSQESGLRELYSSFFSDLSEEDKLIVKDLEEYLGKKENVTNLMELFIH